MGEKKRRPRFVLVLRLDRCEILWQNADEQLLIDKRKAVRVQANVYITNICKLLSAKWYDDISSASSWNYQVRSDLLGTSIANTHHNQ